LSRDEPSSREDRSGRVNRSDRRDDYRRSSNEGRYSSRDSRGSDRGRGSSDNRSGYRNDRRDDGRWRGSYRSAPRRGWPTFGYRPRYPASYRYGYVHRHGYYFPRYYYDYDSYPTHASMRVLVDPAEAEVYVDGYYAGVVDDFDGLFQRLNLTPGRHLITLRLDGYRTWGAEVYATPGDTLNLHHDMIPGPSGADEGGAWGPNAEPGQYGAPGPSEQPEPE
jgi:hypothetical protein